MLWDKLLTAMLRLYTEGGESHSTEPPCVGPLWLLAWDLPVEGAPSCPRLGSQESRAKSQQNFLSSLYWGTRNVLTCNRTEDIPVLASASEDTGY